MELNDQITLDMYVDKWRKIGLSTEPANRPLAEWSMRWLYTHSKRQQPHIEWTTSVREIMVHNEGEVLRPVVAVSFPLTSFGTISNGESPTSHERFSAMASILVNRIAVPIVVEAVRGLDNPSPYMLNNQTDLLEGQLLAGILGYHDHYMSATNNKTVDNEMYGLTNLALSAGFVLALEDVCYISERPYSINLDTDDRLHNDSAPAVAYADGFNVWVWHGNIVTERIIKREFKHGEILTQNNVEIRRAMIDIYGANNLLHDADAEVLDANKKEGSTLYRLTLRNDEPLVIVKVKNSTPEPDGEYKDYYLRVPPNMETVEQAIAWTFDMNDNEYKPEQET